MIHLACLLLAMLAPPFWETKAPQTWTADELNLLLSDSPWAELLNPDPAIRVYLASARPMQDAEAEILRRYKDQNPSEEPDLDYSDFLRDDHGEHLVLAVTYPHTNALADAEETRRMEEECLMRIGKRKYKITGYFPPTPSDPHLRLIFPRVVRPEDKTLIFELYLPGVAHPYRDAQFEIKELIYKGKPEM